MRYTPLVSQGSRKSALDRAHNLLTLNSGTATYIRVLQCPFTLLNVTRDVPGLYIPRTAVLIRIEFWVRCRTPIIILSATIGMQHFSAILSLGLTINRLLHPISSGYLCLYYVSDLQYTLW